LGDLGQPGLFSSFSERCNCHILTVVALIDELNLAFDQSEERVIFTHANAAARICFRAALALDDFL
jgi:hypothetical protein